jgi:WD40 repeat protein
VLRDADTLRPLRRYPGSAVSAALSPDGRTFATGAADGSVRFLDLASGEQRRARGRHDGSVLAMRFSPDGRTLVTTGADSQVIVWDVATATARETFAHSGRVGGLALDPHGRTAFSGSRDGSLYRWDLAGNRPLGTPFEAGGGPPVALSPDGRTLLTARDDGALSAVDTRSLTSHRVAIADGPAPTAPAFGPQGSLVVTGRFGLVERVDARSGRVTGVFHGPTVDVLPPATSADGRALLTGAPDGARLWDATTLRQLGPTIPFWTPGAVAISPDGSRLAATVLGGTIDVLDARSRRRLARLHVDGSAVVAAAFSRDGRVLVAGTLLGGVRIFSARDWQPQGPSFTAHDGAVTSIDVSPDDGTLVTTGTDGLLRLWDVATRLALGSPLPDPAHAGAAVFSRDGGSIFAVSAGGKGYRWDVRPATWARQACAVAGRRLTRGEWSELLPGRPYAPAC